MSTTLADLKADIQDITENTFTTAQLNLFIKQTEQKLLNTVEIPALHVVDTSSSLTADTATLTAPTGYLYTISIAINHGNEITFLLPKDPSFIQEAYPSTLTGNQGKPKHYAQYGQNKLVFGPTPDAAYNLVHTYAKYPDSITKDDDGTNTTWLGDNMDMALLYGSLIEAAIFMKAEADVIAMYKEQFNTALKLFKMLGDGRLNSDSYRNGSPKVEVL